MKNPTGVPHSHRSPQEVGELILRVHKCADCSRQFMSVQQVMTTRMMHQLENGAAWELMQSYEQTQYASEPSPDSRPTRSSES
jgi:hypothetical protein